MINEGRRGSRNQFLFQRQPVPTIQVDGGIDATDIYVSTDRTMVYFTLDGRASAASAGNVQITITDATGTVIKIRSDNPADQPSPTLSYQDATPRAVAGLVASLAYVTVDSLFDSLRSFPADAIVPQFRTDFEPSLTMYDTILGEMVQHTPPPPSPRFAETWTRDLTQNPPVLPMDGEVRSVNDTATFVSLWPGDSPAWYAGGFPAAGIAVPGSVAAPGLPTSNHVWDWPNALRNRIDQWTDALGLATP